MQMRNHKCLRRIPGRLKCAAGRQVGKELQSFTLTLTMCCPSIYRKMRDVYGLYRSRPLRIINTLQGQNRASCLEVISEDEKLRSIFEPILLIWRGDSQ